MNTQAAASTRLLIRLRPIPILSLVVLVGPAYAQKVTHPRPGAPGERRVIGSVEAGFTADHDEIIVTWPFR
jgi:hypothetical protein